MFGLPKFFGEKVKLQKFFQDNDGIEYAYYFGEKIAVFRQTDLDSGRHIQLVKFDGEDFKNAAEKKFEEYIDFVAQECANTEWNTFGRYDAPILFWPRVDPSLRLKHHANLLN